jgi:hypothetical protein
MDIKRSTDLRTLFVNGILGSLDPEQGQMQFYTRQATIESVKETPGELRTISVTLEIVTDLRMTPATFKGATLWMQQTLAAFEKKYGEIPLSDTSPLKEQRTKNGERRYA